MPHQYKILTLTPDQNSGLPRRFNVTAISLSQNITVELPGIILPAYARVGDTIRWAEHKFYDVIDEDGNFVYRDI